MKLLRNGGNSISSFQEDNFAQKTEKFLSSNYYLQKFQKNRTIVFISCNGLLLGHVHGKKIMTSRDAAWKSVCSEPEHMNKVFAIRNLTWITNWTRTENEIRP